MPKGKDRGPPHDILKTVDWYRPRIIHRPPPPDVTFTFLAVHPLTFDTEDILFNKQCISYRVLHYSQQRSV